MISVQWFLFSLTNEEGDSLRSFRETGGLNKGDKVCVRLLTTSVLLMLECLPQVPRREPPGPPLGLDSLLRQHSIAQELGLHSKPVFILPASPLTSCVSF